VICCLESGEVSPRISQQLYDRTRSARSARGAARDTSSRKSQIFGARSEAELVRAPRSCLRSHSSTFAGYIAFQNFRYPPICKTVLFEPPPSLKSSRAYCPTPGKLNLIQVEQPGSSHDFKVSCERTKLRRVWKTGISTITHAATLRDFAIFTLARANEYSRSNSRGWSRTDQTYIERQPGPVPLVEKAGARTVLLVPMLKENELIGKEQSLKNIAWPVRVYRTTGRAEKVRGVQPAMCLARRLKSVRSNR
jgi:hypothetical protein